MKFVIVTATILLLGLPLMAEERPQTNSAELNRLSLSFNERLAAHRTQLYYDMLSSTTPAQVWLNQDSNIELMYIDDRGHPVYYQTNNYDAAETISTDRVWPAGSGGFSLTGAGTTYNRLGIWDGGAVRGTHQELTGRVTQVDSPSSTSAHATHVSGTMIGAGVPLTCPDLRALSLTLSGPETVAPGESIGSRVGHEVENVGTVAAGPFNVGFYISTNSYITTFDVFLSGGREAVAGLSAGASQVVTVYGSLTIPTDWPAGEAWIGVIDDELTAVTECHETNNATAVRVIVASTKGNSLADGSKYAVNDSAFALNGSETMAASGLTSRGMSYQANLAAYNWSSDVSEMATAAINGMNVSNHSYGFISGWYYNSSEAVWYWYGDVALDPNEEPWFGYYGYAARDWDEIAYNAPYYSICKSAGNDRKQGPPAGEGHYYYDGGWVWSTDTRDVDCPDGWDCIGMKASAKNLITVGAVLDVPYGYSTPADVVMTSFSGWGPTDDGRIKPDLVGNGKYLWSCTAGSDTEYSSYTGTSMATPNVSGSLNLLVRYYEDTHGVTPLASTMKALAIQAADEAGPSPGPDYMFGWGLFNTLKAAELIEADVSAPEVIVESQLDNSETETYNFAYDAAEPLRLTLAWTDPPGAIAPYMIDPPDLNLVNDLNIRLLHIGTATTYYPYVLDPANPGNAATTGNNFRDNVEQIHVATAPAGDYSVSVMHAGTLVASQAYSLIIGAPCSNAEDADGDGVGDACDACPGFDDLLDADGDQIPDGCDSDDDNDGVEDASDIDPLNPNLCEDVDSDGCDDCSVGTDGFGPLADNDPSNDGTDTDGDGACDSSDPDDDNDGVADASDANPLNPAICEDTDADGCDDCAVGVDGLGPLADNDPANDGLDTDGDGLCDFGDPDDDNDGVGDASDPDDTDPAICGDTDADGCDDCVSGVDGFGPLADNDPSNDGIDTDADGLCDSGDPDDDNDGVADGSDIDPFDPSLCEDVDADGCDDCSVGTDGLGPLADNLPGNDGTDTDSDGLCDLTDCCLWRVGDVDNSGSDTPSIGDVAELVDHLFINKPLLVCVAEADINQSGGADPSQEQPGSDITIGDVADLVDYLFVTGPELGVLPDCF